MQVAYQILKQLAAGYFCSGQELAKMQNVSRARIWQAIKMLKAWGLDIYSVPGRGYKLNKPVELLDVKLITANLNEFSLAHIKHIDIFDNISSTNDHILQALERSLNYSGYVCFAEGQKKGKGRLGRVWASPLAKNLYCSVYWSMVLKHNQLNTLSLVIGIAIIKAIEGLLGSKPGLGIKWPNDIWYQGSKLCGILVETKSNGMNAHGLDIVIGFGCNINPHTSDDGFQKTSLEDIYQCTISRNQMAAYILNELTPALQLFQVQGFKPFMQDWEKYDLLSDCMITIHLPNNTKKIGRCLGINELGALCVDIDGVREAFLNGEIQVRPLCSS